MNAQPKVGFVGFGEINTPRELIERKCEGARRKVEELGVQVVHTAPVSDDPEGRDVARAKAELASEDFDCLILCVAGWIPSHAVIAVADAFRHKPMLLWGLTGWQEGERFVTTADQAGTTALRKPMADMGFRFKYVVDYLGKPSDMSKVEAFVKASHASEHLRGARIGMMGCRDMNLYATLHDGVSLRGKIGPEIEVFEMLEIEQLAEKQEEQTISELIENMRERWTFEKDAADETLRRPARLYLALKEKVRERGYEAISLIDVDGVKKLLKFPPAAAFMLLSEEEQICTIPENDAMGAVTQLMTRFVTGQIAAYMEFYEFTEQGMLIGVPDFVPAEIVDGPVTVTPTAFGDFGEGLLNISKVRTGKVTLSRLSHNGSRYQLHVVTGEARTPRTWEEAGWAPPAPQLPSLEVDLDGNVDDFIQNVFGQHYMLAYGDHTQALGDLANLLSIETL